MNILVQLKDLKASSLRQKNLVADVAAATTAALEEMDETKANKSDIPSDLSNLEVRIKALELRMTEITANAFAVTFEDLDDIDASQIGIWNSSLNRIEF